MNESRVDVVQLQRRDPQAWTAVLSAHEELADVAVTAVTAVPIDPMSAHPGDVHRATRYLVSLANTSDPVPFIGKKTSPAEALFYRDLAPDLSFIAPRCWFAHVVDDRGWVILDDIPSHVAPNRWTPEDVDAVLHKMARLHFAFWNQTDLADHYPWLPHFVGRDQVTFTWRQLRQDQTLYFQEGPTALISDHALQHLGRLAPQFVEAANGLAALRALGGWPGVIDERHLAAAADLLDDPLPMLEPLLRLPTTLIHGDVNKRHWHLTLFNQQRLLDWRKVALGPAIFDLISFQEQFNLLFTQDGRRVALAAGLAAASEETIIDSYLLTMKMELGSRFDAREMRQAIPAARCLQILTTSFPYFATWLERMPDRDKWQQLNRLPDMELADRAPLTMMAFKPTMRMMYRRFLQAYHML